MRSPRTPPRAPSRTESFERLVATEPPPADVVLRGDVPSRAYEALMRLAERLPLDHGREAVARALVSEVAEVVAPCAVAVVLPRVGGGFDVAMSISAGAPRPEVTPVPFEAAAPQRMFPSLRDESVIPLVGPFGSGSLHLADGAVEPGLGPARSYALRGVAERAALVLSTALAAADRFAASRGEGDHVRSLQARVVQSEKLASVGQIAAKVVHELNNPLTAIVTYAGFLTKKLERSGHDPADVERLRRIEESADRILRLSRELTTYARPNDEVAVPLQVREVVDRAVVFCEHVVQEYGVHVETLVDPGTPTILARRSQLLQVFVNLITNAVHAVQDARRGDEGRIDIVVEPGDAGGARISVSDNGHGISPEHVVRIFDPFFTTKAAGRGTGLGLSIVRSIVEGHGGRVWVRSVVGAGTSFVVELAAAGELSAG